MSHHIICKAEVAEVKKGRRPSYVLKEDEHDNILAHLTQGDLSSDEESDESSEEEEEEEGE